ncbi:MAG: hypothetical protein JNL08_10460 [Planctomycetes bacterium]|nr:hypothetical protein [Planctomycetota bacterium]
MRFSSLVSSFLFAAAAPSQIALPNPMPWPLGQPIPFTIENNTDTPFAYTFCTPMVTDLSGQFVAMGFCAFAELQLAPGATVTSYWYQQDMNGLPVPPGIYLVNGRPYAIGTIDLALQPLGAPHVGETRAIELTASNGAGVPYALGASFGTSFGIPLGCGVHFPLDFDWLLVESLTNAAVFPGFVGVLDADGRTSVPAIVLPPLPVLVGLGLDLAFVTFDAGAPCGFGRTSLPFHVVVK